MCGEGISEREREKCVWTEKDVEKKKATVKTQGGRKQGILKGEKRERKEKKRDKLKSLVSDWGCRANKGKKESVTSEGDCPPCCTYFHDCHKWMMDNFLVEPKSQILFFYYLEIFWGKGLVKMCH